MLPACRCIATLPYGETARGRRPAPGPPGGRASRIETDIELWRACASWNSAHVLHGETEGIGGAQFFGLGIHQCWGREATIGTTPVVKVGPGDRLFDI